MSAIIVCDRCGKWSDDPKRMHKIEVKNCTPRDFCSDCLSQLRTWLVTSLPDKRDKLAEAAAESTAR